MTTAASVADDAAPVADVNGLARGGLINVVGAAASAVSSVAVVAVLAHTLPQREAGLFFSLVSLVLIAATLARLGTPTGLVYFLSRGRALHGRGQERWVLDLALRPALGLALAVAAGLVVGAPAVMKTLGLSGTPDDTASLRVLALFIPLAVTTDVVLAATRGLGGMRATVLVDRIGRSLLQLALVALVAVLTRSVLWICLAWSAPYLVSAELSRRRFRAGVEASDQEATAVDPTATRLSTATFWRFTAPRSVSSLVQIALQRLDILLVVGYLGLAPAAVYTAASRFVVLGQLANQAVSLAAQPRLAATLAREDAAGTNLLYRTATAWLILLAWPPYLLCLLFAPQLLSLFGDSYSTGVSVVYILGAAMLFATGCGMVDMVLAMAGRTSWNLGNSVLALLVNVAVDVALIPRMGIRGAAVGWAAALVVSNLVPLCQISFALHIHPFGRNVATAAGLTGVAFGVLPLAGRLAPEPRVGTAIGLAVGCVLFLAGCYSQRKSLALDALSSAARPRRHRA